MNPLYQTPSSYIGKRPAGDPSGVGWTAADSARIAQLYGPKPKKKRYNPPWLQDLPSGLKQNPALAAVARYLKPTSAPRAVVGGKVTKQLTDAQMIQQYQDMLTKSQRGVLDALLGDASKRRQGELASLAGFGAALQGYSHDLWGQTDETYRNAAAAQQSMAQGLGGQVGSGVAGMRAQEAALAGQLGYEGGTALPTAEAAAAQVASEGGAETGKMIGQVGTAWGGYGATRPEYIGFMTGQNQMQLEREGIESDRDLRSEFLKLGMDNPATAFDMWSKTQENKRQNLSSSLAQQTLRTNIAMQRAKLQQSYWEGRQKAKTAAQKLQWDKWYKRQQLVLDQQDNTIAQQNADTGVYRAETGRINANKPPTPPKPTGYAATQNYQQAIGKAMGSVDSILSHIYLQPVDKKYPKKTGVGAQKRKAIDSVFASLWPQMVAYIAPANRERAQKLLRARIGTKVASWTPSPKSSAGAGGGY